jgi:hypothetical protein
LKAAESCAVLAVTAGEPAAFVGALRLKQVPNVMRQRIGSDSPYPPPGHFMGLASFSMKSPVFDQFLASAQRCFCSPQLFLILRNVVFVYRNLFVCHRKGVLCHHNLLLCRRKGVLVHHKGVLPQNKT